VNGRISRIKTAAANAITPPNLLGIDRRIAYANKKYHSGWICTGVTRGFAGIKFSGSPNIQGEWSTRHPNRNSIIKNPIISLVVK
jgi:hypothetical protein